MEIIKSKNGKDRAIVRIDFQTLRIISERSKFRIYRDRKSNEVKMFDFDGGPMLNVGGKLNFENMFWRIERMEMLKTDNDLNEIKLKIAPIYNSGY